MKIEYKNDCAIVHYEADRLDAASAPSFRDVKKHITGQQKALILNLNSVKFMDSSGLGAVVSFMQTLHEETPLLLCGGGDSIKSVLRKTHLDSIFPLHLDAESAARTVH